MTEVTWVVGSPTSRALGITTESQNEYLRIEVGPQANGESSEEEKYEVLVGAGDSLIQRRKIGDNPRSNMHT